MSLRVEIIQDLATLSQWQTPWENLVKSTARHEPFITFAWLQHWLTHLSAGSQPYLMLAIKDDTLVATLPLVLCSETWHRMPIRTLAFPIGMSSGNLRGDLLATTGYELLAAQAFIQHLQSKQNQWERWNITGLTADTAGFRAIKQAINKAGWRCDGWHADTDLYYLSATGSWEDYRHQQGRHFKSKLRDTRNRWKKLANAAFITLQAPTEIESGIKWMLDLDAHCTKTERAGVVRLTGQVASFYSNIIRHYAKTGEARLDFLLQDEQPIACLVTLATKTTPFTYYMAFKQEFAGVSPGRLLFEHAISETWQPDGHIVDFNGRTPFVRRWSNQILSVVSGTTYAPGIAGRLAWLRDTLIEPTKYQVRLGYSLCPVTPTPQIDITTDNLSAKLPITLQHQQLSFYASGSDALWAGLKALPLQAGDEIAFPSYHCGSELAVLLALGLKPRFYRVNQDLNIQLDAIQATISPQTRAVYVIHYLGWPQAIAPIAAFCRELDLLLIEDRAQALYTEDLTATSNVEAAMTIYSLHKFLPIVDGGALRWNHPSPPPQPQPLRSGNLLSRKLNLISEQCRVKTGWRAWLLLLAPIGMRLLSRLPIKHSGHGLALHPNSYTAITSLDHHEIIRLRKANHICLHRIFSQFESIELPFPADADGFVPLLFAVMAENAEPLIRSLKHRGIEAGLLWPVAAADFPFHTFKEVAYLKAHLVVIPVHQEMQASDFKRIEQALTDMGLPIKNSHLLEGEK